MEAAITVKSPRHLHGWHGWEEGEQVWKRAFCQCREESLEERLEKTDFVTEVAGVFFFQPLLTDWMLFL